MKRIFTFITVLVFISFSSSLLSQPIDTLWSEDFEGNWIDNWYVDAGTWQVGDATSGPDTAYSGSKCAATVLAGNYTENVDSRLVRLTKFTVPSADQNPRLRFWHWFSFSSSDYGYVQIKTEHGSWQNISPQYSSISSNAWTYPSIDLSAFADSLVQISFYFHSAQTRDSYGRWITYVSTGWYIDNIQLLTGNYTFDSNEGFENGLGDWFADRGTWEVGKPTSGPDTSYMSENCLATVLNGNYFEGVRSRFISPPFKVKPASDNPALRFWHWYSFSHSDFGEVYIKTLNQDWQIISNRFSGTSSGVWTTFYTDLSNFADSIVQISFYFQSDQTRDSYGRWITYVSTGWYIDDLKIDGIPINEKIIVENDLGIAWVDPIGSPICGTSNEQAIKVNVKNDGPYTVSNFDVAYSIDNGLNYVTETVYESVAPGDSLNYSFKRKADMSLEDAYDCKAIVRIPYDVNDTNDVAAAHVENARLIFDITTKDTKCNEAAGSAEILNISGRQEPYAINWTTGSTEMLVEDLEAGMYYVTITDANDCISTFSAVVNDEGAPNISSSLKVNNISCYGMNDGSIDITPIGGEAPYNFTWSNGAASEDIDKLTKGVYDVLITDSNGCSKIHSFNIQEPEPLKLLANSTDAECGKINGTAELVAAGGTPPYSYSWNSNSVGNQVTNLSEGLYTAMVTDNKGCNDFITVSISEIDAPQIMVTSIQPATCGLEDGNINISMADMNYAYKYLWSNGSNGQDIQNVASGTYTLTVSNEDETCSSSEVINIPTKTPPSGGICMVSVDSITGGNTIILKEANPDDGIVSTNVYLLGNTGNYQLLNKVDPSVTNAVVDPGSNSLVTSFRYRIEQVDACGNVSEPSDYHETMHVVSARDYTLNRVNLFWNSYKGIDYDFFQVLRYSDEFGVEIIDSVPRIQNKEFYTYTDMNPPEIDSVQYVISIPLEESCVSFKKYRTHNTVRSNKTKKSTKKSGGSGTFIDNSFTNPDLMLYPNPNDGKFQLRTYLFEGTELEIGIFNLNGKLLQNYSLNGIAGENYLDIDLTRSPPGLYYLKLISNDQIITKSFVLY